MTMMSFQHTHQQHPSHIHQPLVLFSQLEPTNPSTVRRSESIEKVESKTFIVPLVERTPALPKAESARQSGISDGMIG